MLDSRHQVARTQLGTEPVADVLPDRPANLTLRIRQLAEHSKLPGPKRERGGRVGLIRHDRRDHSDPSVRRLQVLAKGRHPKAERGQPGRPTHDGARKPGAPLPWARLGMGAQPWVHHGVPEPLGSDRLDSSDVVPHLG